MDKFPTDVHKTVFFTFVVGFCLYFVYTIVNLFQIYTFEKTQAYADVKFRDVAYIDTGRYYYRMDFVNADGSNQTKSDIFIPNGKGITFFGERLYEKGAGNLNEYAFPEWSPDGKTIGVMFTEKFSEPHYPVLMREDGEILSCLQDPHLHTNNTLSIQVLDDERIIINLPDDPNEKYITFQSDKHLSLYNMKDCHEEAVFYDGEGELDFAVSSKMWLAINESIGGHFELKVFDQEKELIYSDSEYKFYDGFVWSKDGNLLAYNATGEGYTDFVIIHDFQTDEIKTIEMVEDVGSFTMSPDGRYLLVEYFYRDHEIVKIDLETMRETHFVYGHDPTWR